MLYDDNSNLTGEKTMARIVQLLTIGFRSMVLGVTALAFVSVMACGSEPAEPEPAAEAEDAEDAEEASMDMTPGVFVIAPEEGSTVSSPVTMEFGHEHFTIEPITDPLTVHEGAGHHHIGLDTDCLPVGEIIPQASPWVHFGDGSNTIEMQLEPGPHRVCLQIGDGEHRTLEGMSAEVTFTVE